MINTLVILFFVQKYLNHTAVIFSPGGVITKAAQLLLELALVYLIVVTWTRSKLRTSR